MIISRTPYRISFFGGGTDYPGWYLKHGGMVLGTAINKYCYITCRYLPPFFEHRCRLVYSKIESVGHYREFKHPAARETLRFLKLERGIEIHHDGDLPARSGMGSSSSFTVGLLNALYALKGTMVSKHQLLTESLHIEQNMIQETVGSQDQTLAAYGGFNQIQFLENGSISVRPVVMSSEAMNHFNDHLMLFYTGIKRTAADVADSYVMNIEEKKRQLRIMKDLVDEALSVLGKGGDFNDFGHLLHESWLAKRSLSPRVSNSQVDEMYEAARAAGALGGKITGAGGGGFMLLFVPPHQQSKVREALKAQLHVPFRIDTSGSQIVYFQNEEDYSRQEQDRNIRVLKGFRELTDLEGELRAGAAT
jgi:D-glycero-alpha-D-manno-heptose-7-phosphate kinase